MQGITNEQGEVKYKTVDDAIKALANSQDHISRIEAENAELRNKTVEGATLQQVLDSLKPQGGEPTPAPADTVPSGLTEDSVVALLEQREAMTIAKSNADTVANKFRELYGEKGEEEFYSQASAKGLDRNFINQLASSKPEAVFNILGVDTKTAPSSMDSSVNTQNFQQDLTPKPAKFDPFTPKANSDLDNWRKSTKATNERLGVEV